MLQRTFVVFLFSVPLAFLAWEPAQRLDALPGTTVTGLLSSISPVPVRQSGIVVRRITVALESDPGMALREGMTGLVMITPVS